QAGLIRVIAGEYDGHAGPAGTFTPMQVWDMRLTQGGSIELALLLGWNVALVVLHGTIRVNGDTVVHAAQLAVLDGSEQSFSIEADTDAVLLLLSGEAIAEPIVGHGPFVMNSQQEIEQAIADFNSGRFGQI
ncbi:MAG: pirin-like C-terminal cupin domain-containing protein, partial [Methylococcales bacterium]